jgi:hypothetical protein
MGVSAAAVAALHQHGLLVLVAALLLIAGQMAGLDITPMAAQAVLTLAAVVAVAAVVVAPLEVAADQASVLFDQRQQPLLRLARLQ